MSPCIVTLNVPLYLLACLIQRDSVRNARMAQPPDNYLTVTLYLGPLTGNTLTAFAAETFYSVRIPRPGEPYISGARLVCDLEGQLLGTRLIKRRSRISNGEIEEYRANGCRCSCDCAG